MPDDTRQDDSGTATASTARTAHYGASGKPAYPRRLLAGVALSVLAGLGLLLFLVGINIVLSAFGGVLLAVLLRAAVNGVEALTGLPDRGAFAIVLLLTLVVIGGSAWVLAPQIAEQADAIIQELPAALTFVEERLQTYDWAEQALAPFQRVVETLPQRMGAAFSTTVEWLSYALVVLFIGLFGASNPQLYTEGMVGLTPRAYRTRMREMLAAIGYTLRWFLIGQFLAMVTIGASVMAILWLFDIPLALVLGLIVGLLGFIPYLGPLLGAVPVALIALTQGVWPLIYVMLAYTIVQLLEGYVLMPIIQHQTVYLPPALTIFIQVLLGAVVGILGFILATPLAAVGLVLARFYRADVLGDPDVEPTRGV